GEATGILERLEADPLGRLVRTDAPIAHGLEQLPQLVGIHQRHLGRGLARASARGGDDLILLYPPGAATATDFELSDGRSGVLSWLARDSVGLPPGTAGNLAPGRHVSVGPGSPPPR